MDFMKSEESNYKKEVDRTARKGLPSIVLNDLYF